MVAVVEDMAVAHTASVVVEEEEVAVRVRATSSVRLVLASTAITAASLTRLAVTAVDRARVPVCATSSRTLATARMAPIAASATT